MRIFTWLLILLPLTLKAQKPFVRDFWINEAATPMKVNALAQDSKGYLWLGTDAGLLRYNGSGFTAIADSIHKPVTAIAVDGGIVYAGYANGNIGIVTDRRVEQLNITNGPSAPITGLYYTGAPHTFTASTEAGVFVIVNNIAIHADESNGLSDNFTYSICNYPGHILAGTDKGINDITIANGKLQVTTITSKQGLPDNIVRVIRNLPGTNEYWIGTQEGGVVRYNRNTRMVRPIQTTGWAYGQVNDILTISATRAWIATETGYLLEMQVSADGTVSITPYHYPDKAFKKLLMDSAGNIWCGTNKGLSLMTGEYLADIKLDAPYTLHGATAMANSNDTLLIALEHRLYSLAVKDTTARLAPIFETETAITSLYIDKAKRLWIGTWGDGLFFKEKNKPAVSIKAIPALQNESIINITGNNESIWVSGLNGVEQLSYPDGGAVTLIKHHDKKSGIGSDYVYQLYPDHEGRIWMATDGAGVCMYDGTQYHHWNSFQTSNSKVAYTITEDEVGDMWAGMLYKDLYHLHNNNWENLRRQETQYVDINVSSVAANATGQVVSVSQKCIDEWYPRSRYFRHFNSAMKVGIDSTSNVLNCIARDDNGNVFVPYQHGILMFRNQHGSYDIKPKIHIAHTDLFMKQVDMGKHNFLYDEDYLSFAFDGVNYTNPERLNYRYKLEGYNNEWVTTRDGSVTYPKLPPGKYTFRVQTSLNAGYDHAEEDSYSFTIGYPFWKTLWFYLTAGLVCFGLIYLYIKIREKRLNKILQLKQERMRFEYEHLKSQINPHFLFNSLNTLTSLIEENKENAIDYTVHLSDLYRYILAYPDKDLILLQEECEILNNYMHIQKSRFGDALNISIDIPSHVLHTKKIIPLALQMLVENSIKHNVVSTAQPLLILITADENEIVVSNPVRPKISTEKRSGLGLVNIVKRYRLLTERPVTYGIFQNDYIVTLPLL